MGRPSKGGAHRSPKRLADGATITYWYAYKGGPRLTAAPGTREFDRELKQHLAARDAGLPRVERPKTGTLARVIDGYLDSQEFLSRRGRTQSDYRKLLALTAAKFGTLPLAALAEEDGRKARGAFLRWRDQLAKGSHRQADYAWTVLNIVLNWAKVRGEIKNNPCRDAGVRKLYTVTRRDKIWTESQIEAFYQKASNELALAMTLALWTGQRQGDLLRLAWSAYDGDAIKLTQSKGGAPVLIPVGAPLKSALAATPRKSSVMLVNQDGVPWSPDGFRVMWRKTCIKAGVRGVTFHDLRGTVVTRLALAGCTEPEIVSLTGHTMAKVRSILDANYLHRDPRLARSAIAKREAENNFPNQMQPVDLIEARDSRLGEKTK
jgi:integrase